MPILSIKICSCIFLYIYFTCWNIRQMLEYINKSEMFIILCASDQTKKQGDMLLWAAALEPTNFSLPQNSLFVSNRTLQNLFLGRLTAGVKKQLLKLMFLPPPYINSNCIRWKAYKVLKGVSLPKE